MGLGRGTKGRTEAFEMVTQVSGDNRSASVLARWRYEAMRSRAHLDLI